MTSTAQHPFRHERSSSASDALTIGLLCEDPKVFLYRDYQDMVYGLDAARLTWHMLPNVLIDALGEESASELVDALLKQHEAEQRLRHSSGSCVNTFSSSSSSAESQTDFQLEVVRRMIDRAEKELSFLKKAAVVVLN